MKKGICSNVILSIFLLSTYVTFGNSNILKEYTLTLYGMDTSCIPQTANAGNNLSICKGESTGSLGGNIGGSATTGVWSSNVGGTFLPSTTDLNATWTPPAEFTGNAVLTLTTTNGCSAQAISTKTITVQQVTLDNTINNTQNGTTLVALQANATYQWVQCGDENTPVTGATMQSFVPQTSGNYGVIITSAICPGVTTTSVCIAINKDDVGIVGALQVAGMSEFERKATMRQGLILEGIEADSVAVNDSTEISFLFLKGDDGTVKKGGVTALLDAIYSPLPFQCFEGYSPVWSNKPGILYTGLAPCNGNVGIGTDSPQARLHVIGSTITSGNLQIGREASNGAMITGYRQGTTNFSLLKLGQYNPQTQVEFTAFNLMSNGELILNRSNNGNFLNLRNTDQNISVFTIDANGNLRLRNATRDIFHINANTQTVFARKIVVDELTWPDYVFEKEYKLRPLSEVKEFIEENGHLPNVPSREKVLQEGVDLGQMVNILVEKIEELTLYSIQQQEEIERLKQLLEQQETNK
jgi:hypothetical protein